MSRTTLPAAELDALIALAKRFVEQERFEEALDLFRLAQRLDPKNSGVKLGLAEVRRKQKHLGRPVDDESAAVRERLRRDLIDAGQFLGLAQLYAEKGALAHALECLRIAEARDPVHPGCHKLYGRLLARRKDFEGAADHLGQAQRFNPFDREAAEGLGRVEYERRRFREALRATIQAFLLLSDGDREGSERLRRRIRTLKQILGLENTDLVRFFRECREDLNTAFDRLEWHRERFVREETLPPEARPASAIYRLDRGSRIDLAARMRRQALWRHFSDDQLFLFTRAVREEAHEVQAQVFAHGSQGTDPYVVEQGEVVIQRPTPYGTFRLGALGPGDLFGEVNFISRHQRSGDAMVVKPSTLLRLETSAVRQLIEERPDLGVQIYWSFWHSLAGKLRRTNDQLRGFFSEEARTENFVRLRHQSHLLDGTVQVDSDDKIRLFREQGLSRSEIMTLAAFSREARYPSGAYIFQEGEPGTEMYVILEGRAMISKIIPGGGEEALAILKRGDFFGEMSLIDGEPRSADAKAHGGPLTVLALDQATVREVLAMDSEASLEFLQLLCRLISNRLREIDEKVIGLKIVSGEHHQSISA